MSQPNYPPTAPYGAAPAPAPGAYGDQPPPPPAASYTQNVGTLPQPATAGTTQSGEAPWCFFLGGLSLGFCAGCWSLIPLCVFSELKTDPRKRKYYLWGAVPCIVLAIIIVIVIYTAALMPALNKGSTV